MYYPYTTNKSNEHLLNVLQYQIIVRLSSIKFTTIRDTVCVIVCAC